MWPSNLIFPVNFNYLCVRREESEHKRKATDNAWERDGYGSLRARDDANLLDSELCKMHMSVGILPYCIFDLYNWLLSHGQIMVRAKRKHFCVFQNQFYHQSPTTNMKSRPIYLQCEIPKDFRCCGGGSKLNYEFLFLTFYLIYPVSFERSAIQRTGFGRSVFGPTKWTGYYTEWLPLRDNLIIYY